MSRPTVIAHRGASGYRPEHTRSAYELAVALGADAVEPDVVATRDGVLVVRHENEISGTTDVAFRPEFAHRRTTKRIDGVRMTGWFTEDFTWDELSTLTCRERLPQVRPENTVFNDREPILRFTDLLELLDGTGVGLVVEVKHPTHFRSVGIDLVELLAAELDRGGWAGRDVVVECFEPGALKDAVRHGINARRVFLIEAQGAPADLVAAHGKDARTYAAHLTDEGLASVAADGFEGISVNKSLLLDTDAHGHVTGATDLVTRAHAAGLLVYTWTLRPENAFLAKNLRHPGGRAAHGDWLREWGLILSAGVDGVFADHPDLARAMRDADPTPPSFPPRHIGGV